VTTIWLAGAEAAGRGVEPERLRAHERASAATSKRIIVGMSQRLLMV
jgi:hypothetical protein